MRRLWGGFVSFWQSMILSPGVWIGQQDGQFSYDLEPSMKSLREFLGNQYEQSSFEGSHHQLELELGNAMVAVEHAFVLDPSSIRKLCLSAVFSPVVDVIHDAFSSRLRGMAENRLLMSPLQTSCHVDSFQSFRRVINWVTWTPDVLVTTPFFGNESHCLVEGTRQLEPSSRVEASVMLISTSTNLLLWQLRATENVFSHRMNELVQTLTELTAEFLKNFSERSPQDHLVCTWKLADTIRRVLSAVSLFALLLEHAALTARAIRIAMDEVGLVIDDNELRSDLLADLVTSTSRLGALEESLVDSLQSVRPFLQRLQGLALTNVDHEANVRHRAALVAASVILMAVLHPIKFPLLYGLFLAYISTVSFWLHFCIMPYFQVRYVSLTMNVLDYFGFTAGNDIVLEIILGGNFFEIWAWMRDMVCPWHV